MDSQQWLADFRVAAHRRSQRAQPDWAGGTDLTPAVVLSLQRFQVGESGDGAHLIAKADLSGDTDYAAAVRLFVAEEQNHARMLAALLRAGGHGTVDRHWSDTVFVHLRRLIGLRLEVMILAIAEVIALRYYRALAEAKIACSPTSPNESSTTSTAMSRSRSIVSENDSGTIRPRFDMYSYICGAPRPWW